jgi:hypothetical protein
MDDDSVDQVRRRLGCSGVRTACGLRAVNDVLVSDASVAATGDSGAGKSSLPRAATQLAQVRGRGRRFGVRLGAVTGLVHGASGILPPAAEAEDHAGEDGEGCEEPERCDGAGAGQCQGG